MSASGQESANDVWVDDVDPDIRTFLKLTFAEGARQAPDYATDIPGRRALAEKVREIWASPEPRMASTEERLAGDTGVRLRIHRPVDAPVLPALAYVHGGGWMVFSLDTHDRLMREYAARAGVAVVGIDYSRAPENPFPDALEEIAAVIDWLRAEAATLGLDPDRIAIGGDSAGGNLSLATNLLLRDGGRPMTAAMLLNYGVYDRVERPSYTRYDGDNYMLTADEMADFWAHYLPADEAENPLARPMLADLAGLPPAFLCIPECDVLADENHAMAARLAEAGVAVTERSYPGATHSFLEAMGISPLASRALDEAADWLRATLAVPGA